MNDTNKEESRERRREEALARRMGEALDQLAPGSAGECPDAEIIAAYHERTLGPEELPRWEGHFAACGRCRKILAVLAAAADTPLAETEVARLGELAAVQTGGTRHTAPARTRVWHWRWLAPALGAAAVLAVWFAMRAPWRTPEQRGSQVLVAEEPQRSLDRSSGVPQAAGGRATENAPPPAAKAAPGAVSRELQAQPLPPRKPALAQQKAESKKDELAAATGTLAGGVVAPQPASPAAAAPPQLQVQDKAQAAEAPTVRAVPRTSVSAEARAKQAPRDQLEAMSKSAGANQVVAVSGAAALISVNGIERLKSPSGGTLWRAGAGGRIERSTDAGQTWGLQTSPLSEGWLAGAAVSDTVCWLAGRNGAIARTTDGEHWERIAPPPMAAGITGKLPDWTAIAASDAQTATVTSSDQRRFRTQDGGKTWQAQ